MRNAEDRVVEQNELPDPSTILIAEIMKEITTGEILVEIWVEIFRGEILRGTGIVIMIEIGSEAEIEIEIEGETGAEIIKTDIQNGIEGVTDL